VHDYKTSAKGRSVPVVRDYKKHWAAPKRCPGESSLSGAEGLAISAASSARVGYAV